MDKLRLLSVLFVGISFGATVAACGSSGDDITIGQGGQGQGGEGKGGRGQGGESATGGGGGSGGAGTGGSATECKVPKDCDDGFDCTIDLCAEGVCVHKIGPNSEGTACPEGSFCQIGQGCVKGVACATTQQCLDKLGDDACKVEIVCNSALALCTYSLLDNDGDGHAPIVCGGDDCDDSDDERYPSHPETCDGKDNDCNGPKDNGATCPGLGSCQQGSCKCAPEHTCGGDCIDKDTSVEHCGSCNHPCPLGGTCDDGQCKCPPGETNCSGVCADTDTDPSFCGSCSKECALGASCDDGNCKCPQGFSVCDDVCVDLKNDPNNCDKCGKQCGACDDGKCIDCPPVDIFVMQDLSGSMATVLETDTRWVETSAALETFLSDADSQALGFGIGFFPISGGTFCVTDDDCFGGTFNFCFNGFCLDGGSDSCDPQDYKVPAVAFGSVPSVHGDVTDWMTSSAPTTNTPQRPALEGALIYAYEHAVVNPNRKVAVILITDGLPNECTTGGFDDDVTDVAAIAAVYKAAQPSMQTFVIGVGTDVALATWSQIAAAGNTGTAYGASNTAEIRTALRAIRTRLKQCQ